MKNPWQYKWKRPKLEELQEQQQAESCCSDDAAMDVTAALVAPEESAAASGSTPLLFTVTLFSDGNKDGFGRRLVIKLLEPPPSTTVVETRELQWPGSMFGDEGVISVELCRKSNEDDASSAAVDALDVVNLMSLGIVDTSKGMDVEHEHQPGPPTGVKADAEKSIHFKELESAAKRSDLILACLTSNGRVHLYKALNLVQKEEQPASVDGSITPPDDLEEGLASLLLGNSLYRQVQQSLFPLSKPYATISLSVPLQSKKEQRDNESKFGWPFLKQNTQKEGVDIPLFDGSFWDATVEKSTAIHRTLHNRPEEVVSIFQSHVAVFGRGTRTRRVRQKRIGDNMVVVEGIEALENIEEDVFVEADAEERQENPEDWWQKEEELPTDDHEHQKEEQWWKTLDANDEDDTMIEQEETGGFVTIIDLYHSSETRTMYLPFAPKSVQPLFWGDMSFVIVLADERCSPDHSAKAIAIRLDSSSKMFFQCGSNPMMPAEEELEAISADGKIVKKPACEVRRFSLLPILLPVDDQLSSTAIRSTAVSSLQSCPPSIELLYSSRSQGEDKYDVALTLNTLQYFDLVSPSELSSYPHYANSGNSVAVVRTVQRVGHSARIPYQVDESSLELCSSVVLQGCSLFRIKENAYFVCWDGATDERGSYVRHLKSKENAEFSNLSCAVLSLEPPTRRLANLDEGFYGDADMQLPFLVSENMPESLLSGSSNSMDGIVVDALDSISSLNYRGNESLISPGRSPRIRRSQRLTYVEKSERLVEKCESWVKLGDTKANRALFESQTPVFLTKTGTRVQILSLRHRFIKNGNAAPFQQIVSWLSQCEDYFTAASIGLGLLRDVQTWRDLRRLKEGTATTDHFDDEPESLEGLLDGIVPLFPDQPLTFAPNPEVVTEVADMTIGCLAKGGVKLSRTLDGFLQRNSDYDPAKAGLMLMAVATRCVSREKATVESAMGTGYVYSEQSKSEDLLWALQSLLRIANSRDRFSQVIVLVNAAMPDELRHRKPESGLSTTMPSMELCKALVTTIIASSKDAANLLLDLVDEESRKRYWASLSRETQLEFALLRVDDKCPLLKQPEVRKWALTCLDDCVRQEASPSAVDLMPTEWLQSLCEGCLGNAECDSDRILTYGINESDPDDDEGTSKYVAEFQKTREALRMSPTSDGLDFDLLVPALLILEQREALWNEEAIVSTQQILDAACCMAGRPGKESFALNGSKVMQQCGAASNVSAGAHLVGGKNGLVLKCCDILIRHAGLDMVAAESYIVSNSISHSVLSSRGGPEKDRFLLLDGHRQVLWLLLEHVLNVRTFGEFHPLEMRGKVDPVFAAQACLRTWSCLSVSNDATKWLVNWLRKKLHMENGEVSPKRLACAALTRALMWPASEKSPDLLAPIMSVESTFLVQLAQSCHGLMESLPSLTAEEIIINSSKKANGASFPSVKV